MWVFGNLEEKKAVQFFTEFNSSLHSLSPSWSTAYGLFQKKQIDSVYSYVTSLLYHKKKERKFNFKAVKIKNLKYPVQVEYMSIPKDCVQCQLAEDFVNFMLTKPIQKIIFDKNFMFSVIKNDFDLEYKKDLPKFEYFSLKEYKEFSSRKIELVEKWKKTLKQ